MREFEQMELEYFCRETEAQEHFVSWVEFCRAWLVRYGIGAERYV